MLGKQKPNFMIIGAMKCATSTLHDQLALQAGFQMSEPKEPNFFSDDEEYERGLDWYKSLFVADDALIKGESSTHYTKLPTYPHTIDRIIAAGLTDVKLIYVVRNPVQRLVSHYIHEWSESRIDAGTDINKAIDQHPELITYSNYHSQITPYIDQFGAKNIGIAFFENLTVNMQENLEEICAFLGYDGNPEQKEIGAKNVSSARIRKFPMYDFLVDHPIMHSLRRALVPKSVRDKVRASLMMKERPKLSDASIEKLKPIFDKELSDLGNLCGLKLGLDTYNLVAKEQAFIPLSSDV